jgi:hypothetical protein
MLKTSLSPSIASMNASIAANSRLIGSTPESRRAMTAAKRASFESKFRDEYERKVYYKKLAKLSAQARAKH